MIKPAVSNKELKMANKEVRGQLSSFKYLGISHDTFQDGTRGLKATSEKIKKRVSLVAQQIESAEEMQIAFNYMVNQVVKYSPLRHSHLMQRALEIPSRLGFLYHDWARELIMRVVDNIDEIRKGLIPLGQERNRSKVQLGPIMGKGNAGFAITHLPVQSQS